MQKNSQNFSTQQLMQLAKSPAGQQLLAMLQKKDPQTLQQAAALASQGDYSAAGRTLNSMLDDPQAQKLLKELGG